MRAALVVSQRGESVVRVLRRWRVDIDIVTEGEQESRALVAALRVSLEQRASSILVGWGRRSPRGQLMWGAAFASLLVSGLGGVALLCEMANGEQASHWLFHGPWALIMPAGLLLLLILGLGGMVVRAQATVTVGSDGVLVRRGLARPLFMPYDQIDRVEAKETVAESVLTIFRQNQAEPIVCTLSGALFSTSQRIDLALLGAIAKAIEEAKQALGEARTVPRSALAKSGRDAQTWARALHDFVDVTGEYRAQSVPAEALWDVVCDSAALETQRAGAAIALRSNLDAEGRARLRVASATSASPELRAALAAAADEVDEGALAEALALLSDEPRDARAASPGL